MIDRVQPISDHVVDIHLTSPLGSFLTYLGWGDAVIVSPASSGNNAVHPIGTGPFKFVRWRKGASISLNRNDNYWGVPAALAAIEFVFIPDPTAAFAAMMAGDVDGFPNYPAAENLYLLERDNRFNILTGSGEGEIIVAINNGRAPLSELKVRQAMSHAIDKNAIIDAALSAMANPLVRTFPLGDLKVSILAINTHTPLNAPGPCLQKRDIRTAFFSP